MKILEVRDLAVPEVKAIQFARFADERGWFTESYRRADLDEVVGSEILQINESFSVKGVARGLHAQWNPYQGKLVRPLSGRLVDLAADIRLGSPSFGRVVAHEMRADPARAEGEWVWIPPGFVHGALFTEDTAIEYLCTSAWSPGCELSISPLAGDLDWGACDSRLAEEARSALAGGASLNDKDREGLSLAAWSEDPRSRHFVHAPGEPFDVRDDA